MESTIFYNYRDAYQIIFFINKDNIVNSVAYSNVRKYEADKDNIIMVQNYLNENGYECGTADGIMGNNTKNAILSFEKDNGLFESGVVDDELLKCIAKKSENGVAESGKSIALATFIQRYNEAIDYYNRIAKRDGYNPAVQISEDIVKKEDGFKPDGNLTLYVNPNKDKKDPVGVINMWSEDRASLDNNVALGEVGAMIYALDTALTDVGDAYKIWAKMNEEATVQQDGITFDNYSFGGMLTLKCQIDGCEIEQ